MAYLALCLSVSIAGSGVLVSASGRMPVRPGQCMHWDLYPGVSSVFVSG